MFKRLLSLIKKLFKKKISKSKKNRSQSDFRAYKSREERAIFISKVYKNYLKKSILDVGCSEKFLQNYIPDNIKYVGVDISGNPDYIINLEKDSLQIFESKDFFTIICTDVLEHLDNIHEVFDDLCRVSEKYIIISLPNPWALFKFNLISGKGGNYKFYGLPVKKPNDRHKWFFNYEEAMNFLEKRATMNGFKVLHTLTSYKKKINLKNQIIDLIMKLYYGNKYNYKNLYCPFIWVLLKRI